MAALVAVVAPAPIRLKIAAKNVKNNDDRLKQLGSFMTRLQCCTIKKTVVFVVLLFDMIGTRLSLSLIHI